MAQTVEGALKVSARRRGISVEEYKALVAAGLKWCYRCRDWHPTTAFAKDRCRSDGLSARCSASSYTRVKANSPGQRERALMLLSGVRWCRKCASWLPKGLVLPQGVCQPHANEEYRASYPNFKANNDARKAARKRNLEYISPANREFLFDLFGHLCAYCSGPATTIDHIVPVANGGRSVRGNLVPACISCNSRKRTKTIDDFLAECEARGNDISPMISDEILIPYIGLDAPYAGIDE